MLESTKALDDAYIPIALQGQMAVAKDWAWEPEMQPMGGHTNLVGPLQFTRSCSFGGPILYINPDFGSQDWL